VGSPNVKSVPSDQKERLVLQTIHEKRDKFTW